jgi:putative peptidoglycan lipid II flippase
VIAGGLASLVYLGCVLVLRVEEVGLVKEAVLAKLGRKVERPPTKRLRS